MGRAGFYDFHAKRINAATNAHIDKLTRKLHQKVDFFAGKRVLNDTNKSIQEAIVYSDKM